MKIILHENQLAYRGTSNALYNYAVFNEELLGNESVIMYNGTNKNNYGPAIERFKERFKVIAYDTISEIEDLVRQENAQMFYAIKMGKKDGVEVKCCKTCIHTVFKANEPHGDVYAYVSKWLSEEMTGGKSPYVPHMIYVEPNDTDLRQELGIPKDAIVFGRHGGGNTFDISFAKSVVKQISRRRKDVYFLFMGTDSFLSKNIFRPYKNVIFLPATVDETYKSRFINTCDAYLHARKQGESFGIAIGEFSVRNKPVITWTGSRENSHIDILGDKALLYSDKNSLKELLLGFTPDPAKDWDAYSKEFSPQEVMEKFKSVFIEG
ncbi:glycosyltransferase family protein [Flavobacterium hauense]